jgi:carboxymethylenebutenolidase
LRVADRLAADGFVALVPDLYHGELAGHDEMDKAAHLMQTMPMDRAARDMGGAVDYLRDLTGGKPVGAIGFCMGGMLTLVVAAQQGDKIGAAVPFYGAPIGQDVSGITAPVQGHYAENDDFFPPDAVAAMFDSLKAQGKDCSCTVYPGTGHAFANEDDPLGTHNPELAKQAWDSALEFLHKHLG